jgi:hypothetical protein
VTGKVATCCYCGTRAVLTLAGRGRHELACRSCGAPLGELKRLRADHPVDRHLIAPSRVRRRMAERRRPGWLARVWDEVRDEVEDIVDDILD